MYDEVSSEPARVENVQREQGIWRIYDDVVDGLSFGIYCPLQDRSGYLWLGNVTGLYRYDGSGFISYTTDDGLVDNNVSTLYEDSLGRLWIGTGNGLSCFDGGQFTNYTVDDGLVGDRIKAICEDRKGRLWFGSECGISCFDGHHFVNYTTGDGLIQAICEDRMGRLWFGSECGISCFDGKHFENYTTDRGLAHNCVNHMCEDRLGRLWIGTRGGVSCFDGERFTNYTSEDGLVDDNTEAVCEDHLGRLWFGTRGGVSCFDGRKFINYTSQDGLLDDHVSSIIQDREGILWFAHPFSGLACFDSQTVQRLTSEPVTQVLIQDRHGYLWYSNRNKLCCLSEDGQRHRTLDTEIFGLLVDSNGHFWVPALDNGLYYYDSVDNLWSDKGKQFTARDGLKGGSILSVLEARDGTIWAGTARPGYLCCFDGNAFRAIPTPHSALLRLFQDSRGRIWMGAGKDASGISCYDGQNLITYTVEDGLPDNSVHSIVEDDTGQMWIGTQQGLCCFDGERFVTYGKEWGISCPTHICSAKGASGQLWFGTLRGGIYRTDGKHFQVLTTEDGLPSNSITGLWPQSDGSMIIGTYRGIVKYRPTETAPPHIDIQEVVANRVYLRPEKLELTTIEADLLTISYHGVSFATRRMQYSYILEGYDEDWQNTWNGQIRYEDLPVGEYAFKVIAINRDLVCSETPATLKIVIMPEQWKKMLTEYEDESNRMQKLFNISRRVNSQHTLSDTALAVVEGLRELGFDRAGVWIRDVGSGHVRGLWQTGVDGNVYKAAGEFLPADSIPPSDGYYVSMDKAVLKTKLGIDESEIFFTRGRDEELFESVWGYAPPCPGYYQRGKPGDNICLCISSGSEKIGIIAVDNYISKRTIGEAYARLFGLVGMEMARTLADAALRESLVQSEARSKAILNAIPDLMFRISRDGVFLDCKDTHSVDLYVPREQIVGGRVKDILPPEVADTTILHVGRTLDSGEIQVFEYQLPGPQGIRYYESRMVASGEDEVLAIIREITERRHAEEQIKASLKEKEVMLKEIHHRVKNNLQVISSMLNLQSGYIKDGRTHQMLMESQSRVRSMALIHEKLYQSRDLARIDFAEYIRDLANYLFRSYGTDSYGIRLETNVDDISLGIDKAIPCGLIVNELISNSLKYGFPADNARTKPGGSRGEIRVDLRLKDGKFILMVSDNGVGFPEDLDFRKTESLGLQLVNTLTDQLEGTIELDRKGGTAFRITFA